MTIAVTAQGRDLSAPIDPRFGRAKFFVIVDTETGEFSTAVVGAPGETPEKLVSAYLAGTLKVGQNVCDH